MNQVKTITEKHTENKGREDLNSRLDSLVRNSQLSNVKNIYDYQLDHQHYMELSFGRFMEQFEMFLAAMIDYSLNINYLDKKSWPANRAFQFIIATRALKQLFSGYNLLLLGSYEDSITVLRSAYESFLRIIFVSIHPECPYNAYTMPSQKVGIKFNATGLVKDELKLGWTKYSVTSAFAHSNMLGVMEDMIDLSEGGRGKVIKLNYEKDDAMISLITNFLYFLCAAYLASYDQLFIVDISNHSEDSQKVIQPHLDTLHEYALVCNEILIKHEASEYYRVVGVDLEHIFKLMLTMDASPTLNWKNVWSDIRLNGK